MNRPHPDFARQRLTPLDYAICALLGAIAAPILVVLGLFFFPLP